MNTGDFVNELANRLSISKKDSISILEEVSDIISTELTDGVEVILKDIGKFTIKDKKARKGRNPKTGESIDIPAKRVVKFKVSSALAERI